MHTIGTLILQSVFRFPNVHHLFYIFITTISYFIFDFYHFFVLLVSVLQEFIHAFISSMTSLEENQLIDTTKDSGGARVIEAFLSSDASGKQKRKLVVKYVLIFYFQ